MTISPIAYKEVRTLRVVGIPRPQGRPRVFSDGGRVIAHSPKSSWYHLVYFEALKIRPLSPWAGPLGIDATFIMPMPRSAPKKNPPFWAQKHIGDIDNFLKAVMDALTMARWWGDDCQICEVFARKRYVQDNEAPGLEAAVYILS